MGEETSNTMNLDLNLGPGPEPALGSIANEPVNLEEWVEEPIHQHRESLRLRVRQRWRRRQLLPPQTPSISIELNQMMLNSNDLPPLPTGEGSITPEERTNEALKTCELNNKILEEETLENKDGIEKDSENDGSFFDCNICLDLAREPVVTCCGHLFCWPCLYRWLHLHSDTMECPVCKGEVTNKTITPIYGCGDNAYEQDEDVVGLKIPKRPPAKQVESLRQSIQRTSIASQMEAMIRQFENRTAQSQEPNSINSSHHGSYERLHHHTLLTRMLNSRGMRREQAPVPPSADVVDLTEGGGDVVSGFEVGEENRQFRSRLLRRTHSHRQPDLYRLVDVYLRNPNIGRTNREQGPPGDDRDSFLSIAAGINSESPMDTAVEIDSMVSLSTSSRRTADDSGDSRAPRRRRLN